VLQKLYPVYKTFPHLPQTPPAKIKKNSMNIENTQSQMRKGILEFCILSIIRRGEAYPSDIVEEMRAVNLQILEGTLYPLLTRLKNADMLGYRWIESNSGPPRKYFSLTEKGEAFYQELEATWNELANAVNQLASKREALPSIPENTTNVNNNFNQ
jgi:PadR family transcriptional regulator, regulatory protein PadR